MINLATSFIPGWLHPVAYTVMAVTGMLAFICAIAWGTTRLLLAASSALRKGTEADIREGEKNGDYITGSRCKACDLAVPHWHKSHVDMPVQLFGVYSTLCPRCGEMGSMTTAAVRWVNEAWEPKIPKREKKGATR